MFVSASVDLKVHSSSDEGVENYQVQHPPSTSAVINISICNDNSYIAILRENEKPQIFSSKDLKNVRLIHTINVSDITALTFKHNTKKNIAMGTKTGDVIMYDTKTRTVANIYSKVTDQVKSLDFTCDDQQLCGLDNNIFFVFSDITLNSHLKRYKQNSECCMLKSHPFIQNRVAIGCKNGHVGLWDVHVGVELLSLDILSSPVTGIAMSSCGNYLITSGTDLKICGIDVSTGTCTFQYNLDQEKPVSSINLSTDDKFLAVGLTDGTLKLYDVKQQMKQIYSSKLHNSSLNLIVFENKAKEFNSNFSSVMKLSSEDDIKPENESFEVGSNTTHNIASIKNRSKSDVKSPVEGNKDQSLDKFKRNLLKVVRNELDSLENQLHEHCAKFQKFLDNEFETIDATIKKKWDVFNMGDMNTIIRAAFPDDDKCV